MDARRLAFKVLLEVERSGAFADAMLGRELERASLGTADRGLATLLVYGTLARQLTLDHTLRAYSSRALTKLEHRVLIVLRLGLFQLAFLDRVPAHAAVDSSVAIARTVVPAAAGFVNAILRRAAVDGLAAATADERPARLAVEYSHPPWLVERWIEELGLEQACALMAADNEAMPTVVRALIPREQALAELAKRGVGAKPARLAPDAIVVDGFVQAKRLVIPHGEASQLVALLVGAQPGETILDACAAPGGKTAYLAKLVAPGGKVVAVDAARGAGRRIRTTLAAAVVDNVEVMEGRIQDVDVRGDFDAVLVDAPCSGLGTLREHPEIRWRRSPHDVDDLRVRQASILRAAASHVRTGGRLVYATCTLLQAENDDVVDAFLASSSDFVEDHGADLHPCLQAVVGEDARLRTFPHRHGTAGFFAARLRRR